MAGAGERVLGGPESTVDRDAFAGVPIPRRNALHHEGRVSDYFPVCNM